MEESSDKKPSCCPDKNKKYSSHPQVDEEVLADYSTVDEVPDYYSTWSYPDEVSGEQNLVGVAGMNSEHWIKIEVLFFAKAREITRLADLSLQVPPCSSAGDCLRILLTKFPRLDEICNSMVFALNEEYAPESTILKNGDELAIIPPISGG